MKHLAQTVLLSCVSSLWACSRSPPPPQLAKAEPVISENASVSEALAEARCAREARCNNVGIDKRYSSLEDCMTRVWTESAWQGDFDVHQCRSGVDATAFEHCLTEIRMLECSSALESLEQIPACRAESICAR